MITSQKKIMRQVGNYCSTSPSNSVMTTLVIRKCWEEFLIFKISETTVSCLLVIAAIFVFSLGTKAYLKFDPGSLLFNGFDHLCPEIMHY